MMQQKQGQATPRWPPSLELLLEQKQQHQRHQQQQQQQPFQQPHNRAAGDNQLGHDQMRALQAVLQGQFVFLTGGAGVGKSFTVAEIVKALQSTGRRVAVTASTGTAAVNVGGSTLHSFAGILDPKKHMVRLAESLWSWGKYRNTWRSHDVLLIDEISMVDCKQLEKIDYLARYLRGWRITLPEIPGLQEEKQVHELHPDPFGGLQVINVGDFFQLAPIPDKKGNQPHESPQQRSGRGRAGSWGSSTAGSGRDLAAGSGASMKEEDSSGSDDDDDSKPKVPVIIAVLPQGFISPDAAERQAWSKAALAAAREAERLGRQRAAASPSSSAASYAAVAAAAAARTAGYPVIGTVNGGYVDLGQQPFWQAAQHPGEQQQLINTPPQRRPSLQSQGSLKRQLQQQPKQSSGKAIAADAGASVPCSPAKRIKQEQLADQQQQLAAPDAAGAAATQVVANSPAIGSAALGQVQDFGQQQQQAAVEQSRAVSLNIAPMRQSLSIRHQKLQYLSQQMRQQLSTEELRAFGILPAKSKDKLQQLAQELVGQQPDALQSFKGLREPMTGLGVNLLLQNIQLPNERNTGAGSSAAAACTGHEASAAATGVAACGLGCTDPAAAVAEPGSAATTCRGDAAAAAAVSDSGSPFRPATAAEPALALGQQLGGLSVCAPVPFAQHLPAGQQAEEVVIPDSEDQDEDEYVGLSLAISHAEAAAAQQRSQASAGAPFTARMQNSQDDAFACASPVAAAAADVDTGSAAVLLKDSRHCIMTPAKERLGSALLTDALFDTAAAVAAAAAAAMPLPDEADTSLLAGMMLPVSINTDIGSGLVTAADATAADGSLAPEDAACAAVLQTQGLASTQLVTPTLAVEPPEAVLLSTQVVTGTAATGDAAATAGDESMLHTPGQACNDVDVMASGAAAAAGIGAAAEAKDVAVTDEHMADGDEHCLLLPTQVLVACDDSTLEAAASSSTDADSDCQVLAAVEPWASNSPHHLQQQQPLGSSIVTVDLCNSQNNTASMQQQQQQGSGMDVIDLCSSQDQGDDVHLNKMKPGGAPDATAVRAAAEHSPYQQQQRKQQQQQPWRVPQPPSPFTLAAAAAAGYRHTTDLPSAATTTVEAAAAAGGPAAGCGYFRSSSTTGPQYSMVSCPGDVRRVITAPGFDTDYYSRLLSAAQVHQGPYTQSGKYGVRFVQRGQVYNTSGPVLGGGSGGLSLGCNTVGSGSPGMLATVPRMSPVKAGVTTAAGSSSSSGRPAVPQWRWPAHKGSYCFKSPAWTAAGFRPVVLKQPFRQNEPDLLRMLDEVRHGILTAETRTLLASLDKPLSEEDGIKPTDIYPTNAMVDALNDREYKKLDGPELITQCIDRCDIPNVLSPEKVSKHMSANVNAQSTLKLKEQAQVVLLWNLDVPGGLANGTRGVVEKFVSVKEYLHQEGLLPRFDPTEQEQQQPNQQQRSTDWGDFSHQQQHHCCVHRMGNGCGCHQQQQQQGLWQQQQQPPQYVPPPPQQQQAPSPAQPQQLPRYREDQPLPPEQQQQRPDPGRCGHPFCPCGMPCWSDTKPGPIRICLPEAPSGVTIELPDWRVMPGWKRAQKQNDIVWINHTGTTRLPLVKFALPPREAQYPFAVPRKLIVGPQVWSQEMPVKVWSKAKQRYVRDKAKLTRTALPLRLAWALTVHRSQGMSISKLRVHLDQTFGAGMVYVALSRCTSLAGLQVVGTVKAPQCDEDVKRFYAFINEQERWLAAQQGGK